MKNKCDVCGQEGSHVFVCCSSMGAISFGYCSDCLAHGYEPYAAIVGGLFGLHSMDEVREDLKPLIRASLEIQNKTEEDLFNDIKRFEEDYLNACKNELPN